MISNRSPSLMMPLSHTHTHTRRKQLKVTISQKYEKKRNNFPKNKNEIKNKGKPRG